MLFHRLPRNWFREEKKPVIFFLRPWKKARGERTVRSRMWNFVELSANREKLLVRKGSGLRHHRAQGRPEAGQGKSNTGDFEAQIDPVAEWRQIFSDAWAA